jgi:large subunit ribosomal protein L5
MIPRLLDYYRNFVIPEMMKTNNLKNRYQVPRLDKIVINVGLGEGKDNANFMKSVVDELALISGQHPVITKAKKSIATFKIRQGQAVGVKVTLRNAIMYEFFDRFVNIALPRVRDFKGISPKSFDKFGNFSIGLKEQLLFPEIIYDKINKVHGMDIIFVLKTDGTDLSRGMLQLMGMPFRKK